jgi:GntR family transcriptional regulator
MYTLRSGKGNIPLYFQLEQILKSKIITGDYMPGEQIPTEKDLCETYQVSSITARQALLNLVNEGLLVRLPGKGTFVTEDIANINTLQFSGKISDLITDGLKTPEVKVLSMNRVKPPKKISKFLRIREDAEVIQVKRTRNANNSPVSYIINYLPIETGIKIKEEDLQKYTMLQILRDQVGIPLSGAIQYIEAIVADYDIASALSVSMTSPILYIETLVFEKGKKPVEFVQTFIRPDRYKYSVKLSMKRGPKNEVLVTRKE